MAVIKRKIGLSLGADLCWPAAYEEILKRLDLSVAVGEDAVQLVSERVRPEPFDLRAKPSYDLVIDRITHWFMLTREWVKKIALMDGVYVLNNPWAIQANEKHTTYCAMMRLGFPIPETVMLPQKEYKDEGDVAVTVRRYNKLFSLDDVGKSIGYPAYLKPYDGGGWVGVTRVKNLDDLKAAYDASGTRVQHLQAGVADWDIFIRAIGVGPQVNVVKYNPDAPLHARYVVDFNYLDSREWRLASQTCRVINAFFNWDFNSCEMLRSGGTFYPIDFANACPDSQVTSLHFHFPWLVKALLRWSIFCAVTGRKPKLNQDWDSFIKLHDPELPFPEQVARYDVLARQHFDSERFDEFCATHLSHLDEVALEYFGTPQFKEVVRAKVTALYPAHEIEEFTDHFFGLVQFWRKTEADRIGKAL